jgi:hypothetical protein
MNNKKNNDKNKNKNKNKIGIAIARITKTVVREIMRMTKVTVILRSRTTDIGVCSLT